jgi:hypothetical protein
MWIGLGNPEWVLTRIKASEGGLLDSHPQVFDTAGV